MVRDRCVLLAALALALLAGRAPCADEPPQVSVADTGSANTPATWECTAGHPIAKRTISLQCGALNYGFLISGCQDPSHNGKHPCAEGNFGMPSPTSANWYWGGFLRVLVNGSDATVCDLRDVRVLERGPRGSFQVIWAHPDAEVGLRLMMVAGENHVDADFIWKPREGATVQTIALQLTCYPSFFTTSRHRQGERHCGTPRIDQKEPSTLEIQPADDTYLYYYDAVFDVAKGEGDGPCAVVLDPTGVAGGSVAIGDYAVQTTLNLKPEAGQARLALCDFTGHTNADAEAYLKDHGATDLAALAKADFRPEPVRGLQPDRLRTDALNLLAQAADDGKALEPKVMELLTTVDTLKATADQGDWIAEADLSTALLNSADLFWKLRTFAALNAE